MKKLKKHVAFHRKGSLLQNKQLLVFFYAKNDEKTQNQLDFLKKDAFIDAHIGSIQNKLALRAILEFSLQRHKVSEFPYTSTNFFCKEFTKEKVSRDREKSLNLLSDGKNWHQSKDFETTLKRLLKGPLWILGYNQIDLISDLLAKKTNDFILLGGIYQKTLLNYKQIERLSFLASQNETKLSLWNCLHNPINKAFSITLIKSKLFCLLRMSSQQKLLGLLENWKVSLKKLEMNKLR